MNKQPISPYSSKTTTVILTGLVASVLVFALVKKLGVIDPEIAKRAVGVSFGALLMVVGNLLPKIVRPLSERGRNPGQANASARFAGWTFVLAGIVNVVVWVLAPLTHVELYSSVVGLGAFGLVGMNYAMRGYGVRPTWKEQSIFQILHALFWVFAIFLVDYVWGDRAAQWTVIVFVVSMGVLVQRIRVRPGLDD